MPRQTKQFCLPARLLILFSAMSLSTVISLGAGEGAEAASKLSLGEEFSVAVALLLSVRDDSEHFQL
jgi:hypothetical protein